MMKYLLDTHILIWFVKDDKRLPRKALEAIANGENEIYYSALSIWEVELKHMSHPDKISLDGAQLAGFCAEYGFISLPLTDKHALEVKNLKRRANTPPHNDPFDRMMLSQAIVENMMFMTHDDRIGEYDTPNVYKV